MRKGTTGLLTQHIRHRAGVGVVAGEGGQAEYVFDGAQRGVVGVVL